MIEKYIIEKIIKKESDWELEKIKRKAMSLYKSKAPSNISLLQVYHEMTLKEKKRIFQKAGKKISLKKDAEIKKMLITRPVRSLSGIVNVSVLTKPYPCPGKCIFCPTEKNMPKSYLKEEPAAMRALMNKYHPRKQIESRIQALKLSGHPTDKIELRIIGGTWSYYPEKYREWFVKECFRACNSSLKKESLEKEQRKNEKAKHRIIGLSVETRPDFINDQEISFSRKLGVTSVELGVQTIDDEVLRKVKRGHKTLATIKATKKLKDAGFKVCYQMMPNLPGSTIKKDLKVFQELFINPDFQPDYLKIYPMATIKGTPVYKLWLEKKYRPYSDLDLKNLLKEIKKSIPRYVRIQRLVRDIPAQKIEAGTKISNLRQIISDESKKENWSCQCIRCREVKDSQPKKNNLFLFRQDYQASQGTEIFLSFEDKERKNLYSVLRLRIMPLEKKAIIREIHTYGKQLAINKKGFSPQHKGLGKKLIKKAEEIAFKEFSLKKISVISSVGARNYYCQLGYRLEETYMVKKLFS
jgi:elongator complex protein 3